MQKLQVLESGLVYWLHDYTAPKVFNGLYFECLVTDQRIPAHVKVKERTNIHVKDWPHQIYKPERFGLTESELHDEDEGEFQSCDNCDLPDACADFGCAVKQGIKQLEW